jgi:hypothetical protein
VRTTRRLTMATEFDHESAFDPRRRLCPDGNCIGILGSDGKCGVCGTADSGWSGTDQPTVEAPESSPQVDSTQAEASAAVAGCDFDPSRRLCSDDTCIGIVGDDDRCKLCGKPALT